MHHRHLSNQQESEGAHEITCHNVLGIHIDICIIQLHYLYLPFNLLSFDQFYDVSSQLTILFGVQHVPNLFIALLATVPM